METIVTQPKLPQKRMDASAESLCNCTSTISNQDCICNQSTLSSTSQAPIVATPATPTTHISAALHSHTRRRSRRLVRAADQLSRAADNLAQNLPAWVQNSGANRASAATAFANPARRPSGVRVVRVQASDGSGSRRRQHQQQEEQQELNLAMEETEAASSVTRYENVDVRDQVLGLREILLHLGGPFMSVPASSQEGQRQRQRQGGAPIVMEIEVTQESRSGRGPGSRSAMSLEGRYGTSSRLVFFLNCDSIYYKRTDKIYRRLLAAMQRSRATVYRRRFGSVESEGD